MKQEQGFSLVEALVAMTITLILVAATMGSLGSAMRLNEQTALSSDLEQNLRSGMNLVVRDFMSAGWGIPTGGIPIPSGFGANPVVRPGPPNTNYNFAGSPTLAAVNPGASLGPGADGRPTDIVNVVYADNLLPLSQSPLAAISANGQTATVNPGTPITGVRYPIQVGDLIAFSNALGNTIQCVTQVAGQTMTFAPGDPMQLNQPGAPQGSIMQLQSGGVFPPTTATRVWMITYYLDTTTDPNTPRLIRRVNNRPGDTVALVLEDLQLTYDLVDGVTNPTNVESPVAPNSPHQIRKVNIFISGRTSARLRNTTEFLRRSLTTQVSLRSLSFVDRYI